MEKGKKLLRNIKKNLRTFVGEVAKVNSALRCVKSQESKMGVILDLRPVWVLPIAIYAEWYRQCKFHKYNSTFLTGKYS